MITPQQIDQISFSQARHGYDMEQVDKILEPLTEDYVALYKENALLKSKMRVLVGKLEEYRKNEAAAKDAVESARRSADRMVRPDDAPGTGCRGCCSRSCPQGAQRRCLCGC